MINVRVYKQDKLSHAATFDNKSKAEYWTNECEKLGLFNSIDYRIEYEESGVELSTIKFRELRETCGVILRETDYTQLADTLMGKPKLKTIYREYRKYIRDLPNQHTNETVITYKILKFEEWLKMKSYFKNHDYEG